jgi:hypothetical protein
MPGFDSCQAQRGFRPACYGPDWLGALVAQNPLPARSLPGRVPRYGWAVARLQSGVVLSASGLRVFATAPTAPAFAWLDGLGLWQRSGGGVVPRTWLSQLGRLDDAINHVRAARAGSERAPGAQVPAWFLAFLLAFCSPFLAVLARLLLAFSRFLARLLLAFCSPFARLFSLCCSPFSRSLARCSRRTASASSSG